MSIIQTIRDKGSKIAVGLVALALIGFILTDYAKNNGRGGASSSTTVGRVNGKKIEAAEFENEVKQSEDQMSEQQKQQGYQGDEATNHQQAIETVWNQEVTRMLLTDEIEKLGFRIGKKELGDILYGPNAPDDIKKKYTDPGTGVFNAAAAKNDIDNNLRRATAEQKDNFNTYIAALELQRNAEKYNALFENTIGLPKWFVEKQNADNSQMAKISYVNEVYASIPDSSVKITDKEIEEYVSKHKNDFKQEESRSISYVSFSRAPSTADSAAAHKKIMELKADFDTTKDAKQLFLEQGAPPMYEGLISGKIIQVPNKDSILKTPVGQVYGPYMDGSNYTLAKITRERTIADTVKVRHILIAFKEQDPQTGQMISIRDSASARHLADSIQMLIAKGQNFDSLCLQFSADGNKATGGVYDKVVSGRMVPTFNDFILTNPVGTKGVVMTDFGAHYIEIMDQKGSGPGYEIAYLPTPIVTSNETDQKASNDASQFAADSRDEKSFDATFNSKWKPLGYTKGVVPNIPPNGFNLVGLGNSRELVRAVYKANLGSVLQPQTVGDAYVVAVVTEINDKGTQSVAKARPMVEPLLINKKKAEQLKAKIGKVSTLEAAASALGGKQIQTVDSLRMSGRAGSLPVYEPRVNGAVFNPANKGKVVAEAIEGTNGVYVIRVDNISTTALTNADVAEQRKNYYLQSKQQLAQMAAYGQSPIIEALKSAATIKDNRADRF